MTEQRAPPTLVLSLLFAAIFLTMTAYLMLAPLLVELAAEFHTSVAIAGQLAAANSITWAITAPLVGPLSDTYGRRLVVLIGLMLMALGILGSVLAWSYGALLGLTAWRLQPTSFHASSKEKPSAGCLAGPVWAQRWEFLE